MGSDWMKEVWACGSLGGTTTVIAVLVSQPDTAQMKASTTTAATLAATTRRFSCMAIPPLNIISIIPVYEVFCRDARGVKR